MNHLNLRRLVLFCRHTTSSLLLIFTLITNSGSGQFTPIFEADPLIVGEFNDMVGSHFVSPSTGYIRYINGVGFSQDSGRTQRYGPIRYPNLDISRFFFDGVNLLFPMAVNDIYALSSDFIVAVGEMSFNACVAISNNRGLSWKLTYWDGRLSDGLKDVSFSGLTGFAVGSGYLLRTTDGGINWQMLPNPDGQTLKQIMCFGNTSLWAVGRNGQLYHSTNNGVSFSRDTQAPTLIAEIHFTNANTGFASANGQLFRTMNRGLTWTQLTTDDTRPGNFEGLYFVNETIGFTRGYLSTDSGRHWELLPVGAYYGFSYLAPSFVWATNRGRTLYKTNTLALQGTPKASFQIDSAALATTNRLRLISVSDRRYQHRWYRNDQFVSASFEVEYQRDSCTRSDTFRLEVFNNTGSNSSKAEISYRLQEPVINSFSPGSAAAGGSITITGSNLQLARSVSFGGIPARRFTILSPTTIIATVDTGQSGSIQIGNRCGFASRPGFTFIPPPPPTGILITKFSPDSGKIGDEILIEGIKLQLAKRVFIGGAEAQRFRILDSTRLLAVVGKGQTGLVEVRTVSDGSTRGTFTFFAAPSFPKITSMHPAKGAVGSVVTLKGERFGNTNALRASFGGFPAKIVSANADSVKVEVPPGTLVRTIVLHTANGIANAPHPFETTFDGKGEKASGTTFQNPVQFSSLATAGIPDLVPYGLFDLPVLAEDLDGDGQPDLVAAPGPNTDHGLWAIQLKKTSTGIEEVSKILVDANVNTIGIALGDLNNDALPEIIIFGSSGLQVYQNLSDRGTIRFGPPSAVMTQSSIGFCESILIKDFDNDGLNDILAGVHVIRNLSANRSAITFSQVPYLIEEIALLYPHYPGHTPSTVICRPLDIPFRGEANFLFGLPVSPNTGDYIGFLTNESEPGFFKITKHNDHPILSIIPQQPWEYLAKNPFVADIDKDGIPDLLLTNLTFGTVTFDYYKGFMNQGNWDLQTEAINIPVKDPPNGLIPVVNGQGNAKLIDFDGDGTKDVYFAGSYSTPVIFRLLADHNGLISANMDSIFLNNFRYSRHSRSVEFLFDGLDDLNGDAKPDLIGRSTNFYPSAVPSQEWQSQSSQSLTVSLNNLGNENVIPICPSQTDISFESPLSGSQYTWQVDTGTGYTAAKGLIDFENADTKILGVKIVRSNWRKATIRCVVDNRVGTSFSLQFENSYFHNDTAALSHAHWHNPNVWSCGVIPDEYTHVIIPAGSAADIKAADGTAKSITIKNGGTLIIRQGRRIVTKH